MPHIHERYDFVVSIFVVCRARVLLLDHKRYDEWLPIGGHIELEEHPLQALYREVREESGLAIRLLATAPAIAHPGVWPLPTPHFLDVHRIAGRHRHIAFVYFATSRSRQVRLLAREHRAYRWFSARELSLPASRLTRSIRFYCRRALAVAQRGRGARGRGRGKEASP